MFLVSGVVSVHYEPGWRRHAVFGLRPDGDRVRTRAGRTDDHGAWASHDLVRARQAVGELVQ